MMNTAVHPSRYPLLVLVGAGFGAALVLADAYHFLPPLALMVVVLAIIARTVPGTERKRAADKAAFIPPGRKCAGSCGERLGQ
jgi:hypothetical protein